MEEKIEMYKTTIDDIEYMLVDIIDDYYYLVEINNVNNYLVLKQTVDNLEQYLKRISEEEQKEAFVLFYKKHNK